MSVVEKVMLLSNNKRTFLLNDGNYMIFKGGSLENLEKSRLGKWLSG